jgi:hypothetical protein
MANKRRESEISEATANEIEMNLKGSEQQQQKSRQ